ncbi:uncharacterized protein LOC106882729 [Octopus bimaculoides]|nr:uncharacterized protein LOC106882729 [Octopus bimaculoides]|eukprot:XP_014788983.1 PREDICTED: uncharacterized protein LOC106882729 [Octopus bimaculoides]
MTNAVNETYDGDHINQIDNTSINDISIRYSGYRTLTLTTSSKKGRIEFLLRRSQTKHQPIEIKYLNFYLTDSTGLSGSVYGLIGQFISWKGNITKLYMQPNGKIQSWIKLENERQNGGRNFTAVLTHNRRSMYSHQQCWTVWKEGKDFIKGKYEDYLIHGLHSKPSS